MKFKRVPRTIVATSKGANNRWHCSTCQNNCTKLLPLNEEPEDKCWKEGK